MTPSPPRTDHERLAEFTQKIGAPPREAKFDEHGHLIELNLAGLNLTSLPPEIGGFVHLQVLLLGEGIRQQQNEWLLSFQIFVMGLLPR